MKMSRYIITAGIIIAVAAIITFTHIDSSDIKTLAKDVYAFDISPDGKQVVVVNKKDLRIISLTTKKVQSRIDMPDHGSDNGLYGWFTTWSPASDTIVVISRINRSQSQLALVDPIHPNYHILRRFSAIPNVAWSPDGKKLAWFEVTKEQKPFQLSSLPGAGPVRLPVNELRVASMPDMSKSKVVFKGMLSKLQWASNGYIALKQVGSRIVFIQPNTDTSWYIEHQWDGPSHCVYTINSWEISPDSTDLVYGFGGRVWVSQTAPGSAQTSILDLLPLELEWTPTGDSLLFVTTDPKAQQWSGPPGGMAAGPPHQLQSIAKDGTNHKVLFSEEKGISNLHCTTDGRILYLCGGNLCIRDLN